MTPNYPATYRFNVKCDWKVTSPIGTRIKLTFVDFATEQTYDWLRIYDGPSSNGGYISTLYNGIGTPADYHSSGDSVYLKFEADHDIDYKGFKLFYSWEGKITQTNVSLSFDFNNISYLLLFLS